MSKKPRKKQEIFENCVESSFAFVYFCSVRSLLHSSQIQAAQRRAAILWLEQ